MAYMFVTLIIGLLLSAWVVMEALRPRQSKSPFAAPRRKEPNRDWDTIRSERNNSSKNDLKSLTQR